MLEQQKGYKEKNNSINKIYKISIHFTNKYLWYIKTENVI